MGGPQVALFGLAVAGSEIADRRFVDLHVAASHHAGADGFVDRLQPVGAKFDPAGQRLPRQLHVVAAGEDLFLTIKRKVVAVFADEDVREQTGRGQSAFAQTLGQQCDDGGEIGVGAVNVFAADDAATQEAAGFVVELFVHLLADAAPGFRLRFHRLGIEDLFDDGKMFGQSRTTLFAGTGRARLGQWRQRLGRWCGDAVAVRKDQFELRGIDLFAACSENPPHECIDLLAQERVLLVRGGERCFQRDDAFAQLNQFVL